VPGKRTVQWSGISTSAVTSNGFMIVLIGLLKGMRGFHPCVGAHPRTPIHANESCCSHEISGAPTIHCLAQSSIVNHLENWGAKIYRHPLRISFQQDVILNEAISTVWKTLPYWVIKLLKPSLEKYSGSHASEVRVAGGSAPCMGVTPPHPHSCKWNLL
jgi:hypothetical protein